MLRPFPPAKGIRHRVITAVALIGLAMSAFTTAHAQSAESLKDAGPITRAFLTLLIGGVEDSVEAWDLIEKEWSPSLIPFALESMYMSRRPAATAVLLRLLRQRTGQDIGYNTQAWQRWMWSQDIGQHPEYPGFKATLYSMVDPKFVAYFNAARSQTIRLDEVVWGGVRQDGIPPLRAPRMLSAEEADYLDDDNIVFGISVNGDARAYPKRILGWHEMFVDTVGGMPVAGVYCTLCGTVILYATTDNNVQHAMGTSGFLFRSNKLMYDKQTQSLWSTMRGVPVVGPLVGKARLTRMSVVTSTWGEWRARHPKTTVLDLDTGYNRDYREGAPYRDYFATDALMFPVPKPDHRLNNKTEIFGLLSKDVTAAPLAIDAAYLAKHPVYRTTLAPSEHIVVLTDRSGANRAYATGAVKISAWDQQTQATDSTGATWAVTEAALTAADGRVLTRFPGHRAFWFGWHAAFPTTNLVR